MSREFLIDQLDQAITAILTGAKVDSSSDADLVELLSVASDLPDLPAPDFKESLKRDLERNVSMSTQMVAVREGFRTVTPYVLAADEGTISFIKGVFGAAETFRASGPGGGAHVELRIGDSMLMVGLGSPKP